MSVIFIQYVKLLGVNSHGSFSVWFSHNAKPNFFVVGG